MNAPAVQAQPQPRRLLSRAPLPRPAAPVDHKDEDDGDGLDALTRLLPVFPRSVRVQKGGGRPRLPRGVSQQHNKVPHHRPLC